MGCCFFLFKQKTAYEMRISDWSSDVCSSDLGHHGGAAEVAQHLAGRGAGVERIAAVAAVERTTPALGFDHDMAVAITAAVVALAAGGALGLGGGEQQEVRHVLAPGLAGGEIGRAHV